MEKHYKTTISKRQYAQKYRLSHPEQTKQTVKSWALQHHDKIKEYDKKWGPINHSKNNPKRISFKGKSITLPKNPRTGICSNCNKSVHKGEIRLTSMHHDKYDDSDPLANTRELCNSCHVLEHHKLRGFKS